MMHHNLMEHYAGQKTLFPEYVIDGNDTLAENFANMGLKAVFTGHFHSQDIVAMTTPENNTIYDIETGSTVTAPCPFRVITIENNNLTEITTGIIDHINYDLGGVDFQTYAYNYINTGLPILVNYMLTNPPFSLDPASAAMITPVVTEAFIAHYHGNEGNPSPQSQAVINYLLSQPAYQMFGMMIMAVWNDPMPDDWTFSFDLKNAQPGYVSGDFHQHTTYTDGDFSFPYMMAKNNQYGLDWWANSEHGGGFNRDASYTGTDLGNLNNPVYWDSYVPNPVIGTVSSSGGHQNMWRWQELRDYSFQNVLDARSLYPSKLIIQSYEMNVPGHEHGSLGIIANQFNANANVLPLAQFEFMFDASDADLTGGVGQGWTKSTYSGHTKTLEAITWLQTNYPNQSYLVPAHPERKPASTGYNIASFRDMNNAGPSVCFGFESMPGHQKDPGRGGYTGTAQGGGTYGGAGYFSARVGGLWDAMLSEGRNWWLFASSDCHNEAGDFYPGEYEKTYTYCTDKSDPQAIVDGLRSGNSWVVEGDLIDSLDFKVQNQQAPQMIAGMGQYLNLSTTQNSVVVKITVRDPQGTNFNTYSSYNNPSLDHIDLIAGKVGAKKTPSSADYSVDTVATTHVIARFDATGGINSPDGITSIAWTDLGNGMKEINYTLSNVNDSIYFRLRGTNQGLNVSNETDANGNPLPDALLGSNTAAKAFADLWFYSNPVFVVGPSSIFSLTILHNNDAESQLIESSYGPAYGGVANFKSIVDSLRTDATNRMSASMMLSSGDNYLAGPEFSASLNLPPDQPYYDAVAMDQIGYDAVCMGNHDFDFGPDVLEKFIRDYSLTQPPYLSANIDFAQEPGLQDLVNSGRIKKSTVVDLNGTHIGVVGLTTPMLDYISSPRNVIVNDDLVTITQSEIDSLINLGINKIILISHLQSIKEDSALVSQLRHVDIAIAGGGDELLTNDPTIALPGMSIYGTYPLEYNDAEGKPVYVVTTPGEYTYVGHLMVKFDIDGNVISIDPESNPVLVTNTTPDAELEQSVVEPVSEYISNLAQNIIATTEVTLDGVKNNVRTVETNESDLVADALLWQATQLAPVFGVNAPEVAFQNGGGIRNNTLIPAGSEISELTTFDMLPFANFVSIVEDVPAEQFKEILENAVSRVENVDGRFAQIAGFEFTWDPVGTPQIITDNVVTTPGTRIKEAKLTNGTVIIADGSVVANAPSINIATIDFLAKGGDQYPLTNLNFTTLGVTYQQALYNYITSSKSAVITAANYPEGGNGRILNTTQQIINALHGWGLISGYIDPANNNVPDVVKKLVTDNNLEILLSFGGIYWPGQNINTISNGWSSETGYKIKMKNGDYFILQGARTNNTVISLRSGVNYLPVPVAHSVDALDIFGQIENQLIFAFDLSTGGIYWPQGNIHTLTQLVPGNGYIVSLSAAATIDFTGFKASTVAKNENSFTKQAKVNSPWNNEQTGCYHLIAVMHDAMDEMENGEVLALFNNDNRFAGQVVIEKNGNNIALVAFGDDVTTEEKEGLLIDETMKFKLFRPSTGETFDLYADFNTSMPNTNLFAENGASMITKLSFKAATINENATSEQLRIYPNPTSGKLNIVADSYVELREIQVLNVQGQLIYHDSFDKNQKIINVAIDLSTNPKGIYIVKAIGKFETFNQKVILK